MRTVYYIEGSNFPYTDLEKAKKAEAKAIEQQKIWQENWQKHNPKLKLDKLISELENCMHIPEYVVGTCTYDSMRVKGMVRVCQKFAEENKIYLTYY